MPARQPTSPPERPLHASRPKPAGAVAITRAAEQSEDRRVKRAAYSRRSREPARAPPPPSIPDCAAWPATRIADPEPDSRAFDALTQSSLDGLLPIWLG